MKPQNEVKSTPSSIKQSKTKKIILISLCVLGGIIALPIIALIILWIFFGGSEEEQKSEPIWKEMHITDEYGATTNEKYVYTDIYGSFSNSATTNSNLRVRLTVEKDSTIEVALYEYGSEIVKDQVHTMKVRHNDTTIYRDDYFRISNDGWAYLAYRENERHICEQRPYIYEGGKLEFAITERRDYGGVPSTYKFTIEDASIIKDALNILNKQDK